MNYPAPPPAGAGPGAVQYELRVERALRGRESATKASMHNAGWEFVSENPGLLKTELTFRRVKPVPPPHPLAKAYAAFRRMHPRAQRNLLAALGAAVAILVVVIVIAASTSGGSTSKQSTASHSHKATPKAASKSQATTATPSPTITAPSAVTDTSVDDLLDRLNAGSVKVGERFRLTGELFESDAWGTGAAGEYTVLLKAKDGKDDLQVFVKEHDAEKWKNGTKVQMVVEDVEATIKGETSNGWLRAKSVKTLSGGTTLKAKEAAARSKRLEAMRAYAAGLNKKSGTTMIESIEPGSVDDVLHVNLGEVFASGTKLQAQTAVQGINAQLVDLAQANDPDDPIILSYYLAGDEVAQNRYILDPTKVKFKGVLDD